MVTLTPENFIQYDPPDRPYQGVNPDGSSPLQARLQVLDRVQANADAPRLLIYEGWADLHRAARARPVAALNGPFCSLRSRTGYADSEPGIIFIRPELFESTYRSPYFQRAG